MGKFSKAVKAAALRANALEISEDVRKEWMFVQVQLELCIQSGKRSL